MVHELKWSAFIIVEYKLRFVVFIDMRQMSV